MTLTPPLPGATVWPAHHKRPLHFLVDHNPCFILSALLMFLGCYLLNTALDARPADIGKGLALLGAINLYEFALIALASALLPKLSARGRDGALLLFVEFLFLADGAFLIALLLQIPTAAMWFIGIGLVLLALFKAAIAMNAAHIPLRFSTYGFPALVLTLIYALPLVLAHISVAGQLPAHAMYAAWWIVGILPIVYDVAARFQNLPSLTSRQQFVRRSFVILPWLLLVAHLGFFHYIYQADFSAADLSPILLGLAVATGRIHPSRLLPRGQLRAVRLVLPIVALVLAIPSNDTLMLPWTSMTFPPALLTAAAAIVTYGYLHSLIAAAAAIAGNLLMLVARIFIDRIISVLDWFVHVASFLASHALVLLKLLLPETPAAWGVIAICTAFILLGLGAIYSLKSQDKPAV